MTINKIEEVFMLVVFSFLLFFVFYYLFCDFKKAIFEIFKDESCNKTYSKIPNKNYNKKAKSNFKRRKRYDG